MSEYWNLRCFDCGAYTDLNLNHGEEIVVKMMACRVEAEALAISAQRRFGPDGMTWESVRLPQWVRFFGDHAGHHVGGSSEYGYRSGGCRMGSPDRSVVCTLPDKHPGDHVWRDRWTY